MPFGKFLTKISIYPLLKNLIYGGEDPNLNENKNDLKDLSLAIFSKN